MTIHHATQKRADEHGVTITVDEGEGTVTADGFSTTIANAKEAVSRAIEYKGWQTEYPNVEIRQQGDSFALFPQTPPTDLVASFDHWPTLADVLDAFADAGLDPEEGFEEEEEKAGGSVVAEGYKKAYAETPGKKTHSGDWLACELEDICEGADGKFDPDTFEEVLKLNNVKLEGAWYQTYLQGTKGAAGRMRMNGSQKLRIEVAFAGKLFIPMQEEPAIPPAEWVADIEAKHTKLFEKRRKVAKAEADAIKEAVEG